MELTDALKFKAGVTEALSTLGKIFQDLNLRKMAE